MSNLSFALYHFPEAKSVVVSGDIHGDFNLLVNKVCVQYQMRDTLVIVAGDCGFGFERKGYYEGIVRRNANRMREANNWIVFIRGNHDNPAYFNGSSFNHKRFVAIPDYSVVKACGHTILCIGGAISIDRRYRIDSWNQKQKKAQRFDTAMTEADPLAPNYYWPDENPVFDQEKLIKISAKEASKEKSPYIQSRRMHGLYFFRLRLSMKCCIAYCLIDITY